MGEQAIKDSFNTWFLNMYLDWQKSEGMLLSVTKFAEHLGISVQSTNHYINGARRPKDDQIIEQIAAKLGDEVYDVLGLAPPDPLLRFINRNWGELTDSDKDKIIRDIKTIREKRKDKGFRESTAKT